MVIEWNKVAWYSKLLALIVFVGALCLGFYLGVQYQSAIQLYPATITTYPPSHSTPPASPTPVSPTAPAAPQSGTYNGKNICQTNSDCASGESCAQTGPITNPPSPKTCWPQGQAYPL